MKLLPSALLCTLLFTACLDEELAYTVEASPVKAEFTLLSDPADASIVYEAVFTELDKSGILDNNIGVIATPVPDLSLSVQDQQQSVIRELVTDQSGMTTLRLDADELVGVTRLEWAGTFQGRAFRFIENL